MTVARFMIGLSLEIRDRVDDGRRPKQALIIRSMTKHIEAQEESKAPIDIKMLTTLSFSGKLSKCCGRFSFVKIL